LESYKIIELVGFGQLHTARGFPLIYYGTVKNLRDKYNSQKMRGVSMSATKMLYVAQLFAGVFAVFVLCGLIQPAGASGASLAVWTDDGHQHVHDLAILEQINFTDDQLRVATVYCTHQYPLESIVRIDFLDYPTDVEDQELADIIKAVHLFQNYPNPFNPETRIRFELPERGWVELCIYSVNGQLVRTLVEMDMPAGPHSVRWDGIDNSGRSVASGVYFYSLATSWIKESRKMILLR
jgi:hypothetical protein